MDILLCDVAALVREVRCRVSQGNKCPTAENATNVEGPACVSEAGYCMLRRHVHPFGRLSCKTTVPL